MRATIATLAALAAVILAGPAEAADPVVCGTKSLFGQPLELRVEGDPIPCDRVLRIVAGRCRETRHWSCFSFRPPSPALVWFRERERFMEPTTLITAQRPACDQAVVTAENWARAQASKHRIFPTRLQIYADDIVRCDQLKGKTYQGVRALLGKPYNDDVYRGRRQLEADRHRARLLRPARRGVPLRRARARRDGRSRRGDGLTRRSP